MVAPEAFLPDFKAPARLRHPQIPGDGAKVSKKLGDFTVEVGLLVLLCHLSRCPLWHAHELAQQQFLGRFEPEPVADLAMHLRQGHTTPVRPRGKKPAAAVPGGLAPAAAATRASTGSRTQASH